MREPTGPDWAVLGTGYWHWVLGTDPDWEPTGPDWQWFLCSVHSFCSSQSQHATLWSPFWSSLCAQTPSCEYDGRWCNKGENIFSTDIHSSPNFFSLFAMTFQSVWIVQFSFTTQHNCIHMNGHTHIIRRPCCSFLNKLLPCSKARCRSFQKTGPAHLYNYNQTPSLSQWSQTDSFFGIGPSGGLQSPLHMGPVTHIMTFLTSDWGRVPPCTDIVLSLFICILCIL